MYAKVIIEIGVKNVDKKFTYIIPEQIKDKIKVGCRVTVPFGYQILEGFVLEILDTQDENHELKQIIELIDEQPILNQEMLELGKKMSTNLLCSLISAYQVMLPKALKASHKTDIKIKLDKYITLNKKEKEVVEYIMNCKYPKQKEILTKLLNQKEMKITRQESTIKTLLNHELIKITTKEKYRYPKPLTRQDAMVTLTEEQQIAIQKVISSLETSKTFLLYGVTGSGKTEVYMNIIKQVLNHNKSAIMLVPEISLTPQIVNRFMSRFKNRIAVLHSGLNDTERYDEYRKIKNGLVDIVIGARSAIFAPLEKIGVIIIDEEHSTTYKQDNHPRYDAKEIALQRSKYHHCPVILGSATPSLESFARAGNHVYELLTLTKRPGTSILPKVEIIDMKEELKKGNFIFSQTLKQKIQEKIEKNQQIILLLNRRGYSSMLTCSKCGNVEKCPRCDISLTYHKTSDMLRCHYCGYAIKRKTECSNCHSRDLKDFGLGTQKLEEELNNLFPNARIIRMDMDTTTKKGAHQKMIDKFANHEYDILVGTQMIAKGLDFPLVTLVGVINADTSLNIPDFRSSERTFQLLCQVSGRAGRNEYPGEVIIQTYNNTHYSITLAKNHNYLEFYKEEMKIRKQLNYSPYYFITLVSLKSKDYDYGFNESKKIGEYLRNNIDNSSIVLGPSMANPFKINNIYHYNCIIKYRYDEKLKSALIEIDNRYKNDSKCNVEIDINPNRL